MATPAYRLKIINIQPLPPGSQRRDMVRVHRGRRPAYLADGARRQHMRPEHPPLPVIPSRRPGRPVVRRPLHPSRRPERREPGMPGIRIEPARGFPGHQQTSRSNHPAHAGKMSVKWLRFATYAPADALAARRAVSYLPYRRVDTGRPLAWMMTYPAWAPKVFLLHAAPGRDLRGRGVVSVIWIQRFAS